MIPGRIQAVIAAALLALCGASQSAAPAASAPDDVARQNQESVRSRLLLACRLSAVAGALQGTLGAAMLGDEASFRRAALLTNRLRSASMGLSDPQDQPLKTYLEATLVHADRFLALEDAVLRVDRATSVIRDLSPKLLHSVQELTSAQIASGASIPHIAASSSLEMLTQRLGKAAAELVSVKGIDPEAVFLLKRDAGVFQELTAALVNGRADLRLNPASTPNLKRPLNALRLQFVPVQEQVDTVLTKLKEIVEARETQARLTVDLEKLGDVMDDACYAWESQESRH
jgi:twitching motility protein PilJ